jgi:hypothetical protein
MTVRLSGHDRKQLAERIKADIDAFCVAKFTEEPRNHLGASIVGRKCAREIVMAYRWMAREEHNGRKLRLFNRGHKEEARFVEWLRGIGADVREFADDGKQFRMSGAEGHYGGSLDGMMRLPTRYGLAMPFLLEMKTHNDKSFQKLLKDKMIASKPEHYAQMCAYGDAYELDYGVYIATNKNDDELYVEVIEINGEFGKALALKARTAIYATQLPPKIAASAAYFDCKWCAQVDVCQNGIRADINCRSCRHSVSIENAQWACKLWNAVIPREAIPAACGQWEQFT